MTNGSPSPVVQHVPSARDHLPGCGLGVYFALLVGIGLSGVMGVFFSLFMMHGGGGTTSPLSVTYGGAVDPSQLAPLREAGLLGPKEIPDVFHPETYDGSHACAIVGGALLRLGEKGGERLSLATVTSVVETPEGVRVVGEGEIHCLFGPKEGASRFAAMLRAR